MDPELKVDLQTVDQKIAQACKKVGQMLPLLKDDKKLSIEDFLTLESEEDNLEQLKQQRGKDDKFDPETLCKALFDHIKRRIMFEELE